MKLNYLGYTLIAASMFLSAVFASTITIVPIVSAVFIGIALILEATKFSLLQELRSAMWSKDSSKTMIIGTVTAALVSFSAFAGFSAVESAVQKYEKQYTQEMNIFLSEQKSFEQKQYMFNTALQAQQDIVKDINDKRKEIEFDKARVDRNSITDARIRSTELELQRLEQKRDSQAQAQAQIKAPVAPVEPTKPVMNKTLAVLIALLVEATSLCCNFYRTKETSEIKSIQSQDVQGQDVQDVQEPIVHVQPKEHKEHKEPVQSAQKVQKIPKPKAKTKAKFSLVHELNLTSAERIFISRWCTKNSTSWKEFNIPANINRAAQLLKERK